MTGIQYTYGRREDDMTPEQRRVHDALDQTDLDVHDVVSAVCSVEIHLDVPELRALLRRGQARFRAGPSGPRVAIEVRADRDERLDAIDTAREQLREQGEA